MSHRRLRIACASAPVWVAALALFAIGCGSDDPIQDENRFAGMGGMDNSADAGEDVCTFNCERPDARDSGSPSQDAREQDGARSDGPESHSCDMVNDCASASDIGSIAGDKDNDVVSRAGTTSQWLRVRVSEDISSVLGSGLKTTISLMSPAGSNYDLFAYVNSGTDERACGSPTADSVMPAGVTDTVTLDWGETLIPNKKDDSRTVSIEVRYIAGVCGAEHEWDLMVHGNK